MTDKTQAAEQEFLADYDPYAFPPVAVTADVVALTIRSNELCVLLVRRARPPYEGSWALPGGFLSARRPGEPTNTPLETIDEAAARALAAKTGLTMSADTQAVSAHNAASRVYLEQLRTYGDQARDPRMTVVSVAYVALAPSLPKPTAGHGTTDARWVPIAELEIDREEGRVISQNATAYPLAFDHAQIIADGVERARAKLEYSPLAAAFVGEEFSIADLRHVYEIVWGEPLHPSNFARKVLSTPGFVEGTGTFSAEAGTFGGPRAKLYRTGDCALLHPPILRAASERKIR